MKVSAEYTVYLLRKKRKKLTVFSHKHWIYPCLVRWQREPTRISGRSFRERTPTPRTLHAWINSQIQMFWVKKYIYPNLLQRESFNSCSASHVFMVIIFWSTYQSMIPPLNLSTAWNWKNKSVWVQGSLLGFFFFPVAKLLVWCFPIAPEGFTWSRSE